LDELDQGLGITSYVFLTYHTKQLNITPRPRVLHVTGYLTIAPIHKTDSTWIDYD